MISNSITTLAGIKYIDLVLNLDDLENLLKVLPEGTLKDYIKSKKDFLENL